MNVSTQLTTAYTARRTVAEEIAPGITVNWLADRRIVFITFGTVLPDSVDAAMAYISNLIDTWPANRPFLSVLDFASKAITLTPAIRSCILQIVQRQPDIAGSNAVILPRSFAKQMLEMSLVTLSGKHRESEVFFTAEEGITWLWTWLV